MKIKRFRIIDEAREYPCAEKFDTPPCYVLEIITMDDRVFRVPNSLREVTDADRYPTIDE